MNRPDPLPVEALVTPDQRRLAEALDAVPPIPASAGEECADCWQHLPGPARTRKASDAARVLRLLDEIGKDGQA